jgi:hypothetical protein
VDVQLIKMSDGKGHTYTFRCFIFCDHRCLHMLSISALLVQWLVWLVANELIGVRFSGDAGRHHHFVRVWDLTRVVCWGRNAVMGRGTFTFTVPAAESVMWLDRCCIELLTCTMRTRCKKKMVAPEPGIEPGSLA